MDRKAIIVLVASFALILFWPKLINHFYPPPPKPDTDLVSTATNDISFKTRPTEPGAEVSIATPLKSEDAPEETITLTNENGRYVFTSHGGGLKLIELQGYRADIECGRKVPAERQPATLNTGARVPVLAMMGSGLTGKEVYNLTKTGTGVRAERPLGNGLQIIKTFELSTNYLVKANVRIENRSKEPLQLSSRELVVGTSTPMSAHDQGMEMGVFWYDGSDAEHVNSAFGTGFGCGGGSGRTEYVSPAGASNVVWGAVHNRFFTIATVPSQPANQIISRRVELAHGQEMVASNYKAITNGLETTLIYPAAVLNAGDALENSFQIYAGPKEYNLLARLGARFGNNLDAVMDFGFFKWVAQGLLLTMNKFHSWGVSYGIAIILITILIKLIFWPLTNASTKSMKRMQLLQPQMKALQEKYKEDPRKMNMKLMEFMKEHKVSPLGGCLPMVIQIPIFIGFYQMLRSAIELRDVSFLWACDLSQADTIGYIAGFPINPLPVIWGVTMLWQARTTPMAPGMDPTQQKIMKYMPLMILFFLYKMSAGLTLYWTVQNLLTILQMKLTKAVDVTKTTTPKSRPTKFVWSGQKKKKK
ncbi:MAG: membrane protein insertase YidC [Verrucomicrobia bacterium]|nr:membrane protein insertase YidC [Verrucomicrobiota bacterium]